MNTEEQIADLMKPRVILENKYPNCPYEVGEILYEHEYGNGNKYFALENGSLPLDIKSVKDFPYIFQPIPWYAERKPEEMPEYVKAVDIGSKTIHVVKVITHYVVGMFEGELDGEYWEAPYKEYLPATEQQYNQYINSKK